MNNYKQFTISLFAFLTAFVSLSVLQAGGTKESKAQEFMDAAAQEHFPDIPVERVITSEEIASLLALGDEENDEELIGMWESLIIDQKKAFATLLQDYSYGYGIGPINAFGGLANLMRRSPEYADRIFYLISVMIEKASYNEVFNGMPSFSFLTVFIERETIYISSDTLKILHKSIPSEKIYILAFHLYTTKFQIGLDVKQMYQVYHDINRENHKDLLKELLLTEPRLQEYGIIDIDNLNYKLNEYYRILDLIEERLVELGESPF